MKSTILTLICLFLFSPVTHAASPAVTALLDKYQAQGAGPVDIHKAQRLWQQPFKGKSPFEERSCTSCHQLDLTQAGQHVRTKKTIKPMATSVNPARLSSAKKIEKWFLRNCKWTLGRECSPSEKAGLLVYLSQQ